MNNTSYLKSLTNGTDYQNFWSTSLKIRDYGAIVCFTLGLLFNYVIVRFFSKRDQLNYVSISIYVLSLALSDQLKLFFELPFDLFLSNKWTDGFCEFYAWGKYTFGETSSFIIVFLCIDRLLIFRLVDSDDEVKINKGQKRWRALVVCLVFMTFVTKNGIFFILNLIDPFRFSPLFKSKTCSGYNLTSDKLNKQTLLEYASYNLSHQVLYSYLPALLVISLNFYLIYLIWRYLLSEPKSDIPSSAENNSGNKIKQVKKNEATIALISMIFLVTNLPHEIFRTIVNYQLLTVINEIEYFDGIGNLLDLFQLFGFFLKFFAYLITFRRIFSHLKKLPCSICKQKKKYKITMKDKNNNNFVATETNL